MLWLHLRKLKSEDGAVRTKAAHAIAEGGSARAIEPLGTALADRDWDDRSSAAVALGKLGNGRGVPFLARALRADPDVDVRCGCAWALGRIGGTASFEPLGAALDDDSEAVRRVATEALAKLGTTRALESLSRAAIDRDHDVRLVAVRGLGVIGSGGSAPRLLAALDDAEWSVRGAAAEALGKMRDSTAVPALLEALRGDRLSKRLVAAEALGHIGDARAVDHLVASLASADGPRDLDGCDPRLRRNVAKALGDIGKASALPALLVLLEDRYTAGVALDAIVNVLRREAAAAETAALNALSELSAVDQTPWMVDEAEEAKTGRVVVRQGKPWKVDAREARAAALAELRRRIDDLGQTAPSGPEKRSDT